MSVDFTPSRGEYTELKPFRYWCQKVLPLVYDDSLSYYELLSKILDSLNKAMEDVETLNDDVTALYEAYTSLQNWVNTYVETFFEGEGIANAVDAGIDRMVVSGEFGTIVNDKVAAQINAVVASQLGTVVQGQLPSVVQTQIPGVVQSQLPGVVNNQIGGIVDAWLSANITPDTTLLDRTINAANKAPSAYDMKNMLQAMKSDYSFIDKYTMFDYPGDITTGRNDLAVMEYMTRTWLETVSNKTVFIQYVKKGNSLNLYNASNNEVHCYPSLIPITRNLLPPLSADFSIVDQAMPTIPNVVTSYNKAALLNYFVNLKSYDTVKIVVDIPITNTGSETPVVCLTGWKLVKIYVNNNTITSQNLADFTVTGSVASGNIHAECEYKFGDINREAYDDPATVGFGLAILTGDTSVELTTYQESGFEEGVTYSDNTNFFPKDSGFNITITGEVVDAEVANLKKELTNIIEYPGSNLTPYLFKRDCYIGANEDYVSLSGYDLYKIPVQKGDIAVINQVASDEMFYGGLVNTYALHYETSNGYEIISSGSGEHPNYYFEANRLPIIHRGYLGLIEDGTTALIISVKRGNENKLNFAISQNQFSLNDTTGVKYTNTVYSLNELNSIFSHLYFRIEIMSGLYTAGYNVRFHRVNQGDKIIFSAQTTGIAFIGFFINSETLTRTQITTLTYIAPNNGFVEAFYYDVQNPTVTIYPVNSIKLDWTNIKNIPDTANTFVGLTGVAFGTSLTYRAISSWGYLDYLPDLSGMTFDNQGIGSSVILGNMLAAIKAYTGYSGKRVCIIEGFVNDWYQNNTLGTYDDDTETTVCGCVRSAINYIMSQNANMTIFLILDHYGKLNSGVDCRSYAENSGGLTQLQYYDEIAKVAQSLGVPVIKLYADSQISENTPQYLNDNIHPTDLGAKQTAYTIWSKMKQCYPNQISG